MNGEFPADFADALPVYEVGSSYATRSASGDAINAIAQNLPSFFGGSADLAGSNKTTMKNAGDFAAENYAGKNIWFGVREFAMGAALNGMALTWWVKRIRWNILRISVIMFDQQFVYLHLMGLPVTYVFTHDSVLLLVKMVQHMNQLSI